MSFSEIELEKIAVLESITRNKIIPVLARANRDYASSHGRIMRSKGLQGSYAFVSLLLCWEQHNTHCELWVSLKESTLQVTVFGGRLERTLDEMIGHISDDYPLHDSELDKKIEASVSKIILKGQHRLLSEALATMSAPNKSIGFVDVTPS